MATTTVAAAAPEARKPRRWPWVAAGLSMEAAAALVIAGTLFHESGQENAIGAITKYSLRLAWQEVLHRHSLSVLMIVCALVYMAGATLAARPFVHSRLQLLLVVPVAALVSLVVLGVLALVLWAMFARGDGIDLPGPWDGWSFRRRRPREPRIDLDMP